MGDHHVDEAAYSGSARTQWRIGVKQNIRPQTTALLDMLAVLQSALSDANRVGDLEGAREAVAGRVSCWIELADLADEVHPAYAMACRRLAWIEGESLPADPEPRDRGVPARGAFASRSEIARQMELEGRHAAGDRSAVAARRLDAHAPFQSGGAPRHLAPGRVGGQERCISTGRHSAERQARPGNAPVSEVWSATVPDARPSESGRPAGWHPVPRPRQPEDHLAYGLIKVAG